MDQKMVIKNLHTLIKKKNKGGQRKMNFKGLFDFSEAIKYLKEGKRVKRIGWNGKTQYIQLANNISYLFDGELVNCEHKDIGSKAIAFVGTRGIQIGWLASQADMLAEDWCLAE